MINKVTSIIVGGLNTDIVLSGIENFPGVGQYSVAKKLSIGPGGKSRNVANMLALLVPKNTVAFIGRTVKDKYGLWEIPLKSLNEATVHTENIAIVEDADKMPGLAVIPVNKEGSNKIYVAPGITSELSKSDIDKAEALFKAAGQNFGLLVLTSEMPGAAAVRALELAKKYGLRTLYDPGGISSQKDALQILKHPLYLLKPNEQEAALLSGLKVTNLLSAEKAARKIYERFDIQNILITAGKDGGYLFDGAKIRQIPIPIVSEKNGEKDETGCGDQTFAAIAAKLQESASLLEACEFGIKAGTLQFHRAGIQPVELHKIQSL